MSNIDKHIDKQALREVAENAKAVGDISRYEAMTVLTEFEATANPATVLALLDELEAKDRRIEEEIGRANREHHRGFMMACGHLKEHSNVHYTDAAEMEIAALRKRINELENAAPPVPVSVPDDYFAYLVTAARIRADKAMRKFPQPNYVLNKVAEESGEVIKAVIHYTEGREDWANVEGEIIDNLAMLIRLVSEGDQVIGFTPPESGRAAMLQGAELVSNRDELPHGWVACSERMPEENAEQEVLACFKGGDISTLYYFEGRWDDAYGIVPIRQDVTHWMPLPAAPQKELMP